MRSPRAYWRWFWQKVLKDGWEPTDTGWTLTIVMIWAVSAIAYPIREGQTQSKLDEFLTLRTSEMGDTLAGVFSALAFIWIIVTVFMQSREMREQRREFHEQRVATQDMARAMSVQAEMFEQEQKQRLEEYASLESEAINKQLHSILTNDPWINVELEKSDGEYESFQPKQFCEDLCETIDVFKAMPTPKHMGFLLRGLNKTLPKDENLGGIVSSEHLERVQVCLGDLNKSLDKSSPATRRNLSSEKMKKYEFLLTKYFGASQ